MPRLQQAAEPHQQQAHGTVGAHEGATAVRDRLLNIGAIHRVEYERRVRIHAQGARRIDPHAVPALGTKTRHHRLRVGTALALQQHVVGRERSEVRGVPEESPARPCSPRIRGGEELGVEAVKVSLRLHPRHQD